METKLKVLLVDDEKLERVLIKKGFPWEENGFEIIGEAESGKEALEFMKHRRPDLILTDISMPNMSGLKLAETVAREYPDCHIVIITGYREFEYARQALKIGVEDFLLKPVNIEEIGKVTEKIKKVILEKREKQKEVEKLKESLSAEQDILMESFFQRLVEKRVSKDKAEAKLKVYGYEKLLDHCCCLNISVKEDSGRTEISEQHKRILDYIWKRTAAESVFFVHYMHNIIMLFMDGDAQRTLQYTVELFHAVIEGKIEATLGLSEINTGFEGIAEAFEQSEKALSASVLLGQNRLITYGEYQSIMKKSQPMPVFSWEEFSFALTNILPDKVKKMTEEYIGIIKRTRGADVEYLRLLTMDMLSKAGATLSPYGTNLFQLMGEEQLFRDIRTIQTIEESEELLQKSMKIVLEFHEKKKTKKSNRVVEQALEYVKENYCDPDLTLKVVAENVYSNESYLSRVFKKEVGQSLIEYVTKKRIDESIRLLNTTDLKVYEIAEKTGFRDPHYFGICFKKQVGVTVKEFRKR